MSAAPMVARLLARAFPGLAARDLGLPGGRLLPWLPGVRIGHEDPLGSADASLFGRFRQAGRPLLGGDPMADARPDPAWDAAAERLTWRRRPDPVGGCGFHLLEGGLGEAPLPPGQAQVLLLLGCPAAMERHALLVPEARLAEVFDRLRDAAGGMAGPGWQVGGRVVAPRVASLGVLAAGPMVERLALAADALPQDRAEAGALDGVRQLRILLGALPARRWTLRLGFGSDPGPVALLVDGLRQPVRRLPGGGLMAEVDVVSAQAVVLGLAWAEAAPPGLRLGRIEAEG